MVDHGEAALGGGEVGLGGVAAGLEAREAGVCVLEAAFEVGDGVAAFLEDLEVSEALVEALCAGCEAFELAFGEVAEAAEVGGEVVEFVGVADVAEHVEELVGFAGGVVGGGGDEAFEVLEAVEVFAAVAAVAFGDDEQAGGEGVAGRDVFLELELLLAGEGVAAALVEDGLVGELVEVLAEVLDLAIDEESGWLAAEVGELGVEGLDASAEAGELAVGELEGDDGVGPGEVCAVAGGLELVEGAALGAGGGCEDAEQEGEREGGAQAGHWELRARAGSGWRSASISVRL